jgi:hypothetical protein
MANGPLVPPVSSLDALSKVIVQVGFPVVVAAILLWFILGKFQSAMTEISTKINQNGVMAAELIQAQQTLLEQQKELQDQVQKVTERQQRGGVP